VIQLKLHCGIVTLHLARCDGNGKFIGDPDSAECVHVTIAGGEAHGDGTPRVSIVDRTGVAMATVDGHAAQHVLNHMTMLAGIASGIIEDPVARELATRLNRGERPAKATDVAKAATDFIDAATKRQL